MKEFKTFIFGVIGLFILCIFGLLTFCNAGSFTYTGHFDGVRSNSRSLFAFPTPLNGFPYNGNVYVNCNFSNYSSALDSLNLFATTYGIVNNNSAGQHVLTGFSIPINNIDFELYGATAYNRILGGVNIVSNGSFTENVSFDWSCTVYGTAVLDISVCDECETCPEVDTGAILSGYIAIDDITDNYCISNGLCGEISTGLSTLYINDIRHESKPFIYVNIPEEFDWDYTGNVAEINIDVKGYNTDSDYIAGIINTQISKPTSEDLGNLINVVAKFIPGLVIILFIYFIFRFIKKIF